jgi:DNA invertase Pin-like site-specific DNA recombinase
MDAISAFAKQNSIQLDRAFVHVGTGSGIVSATIRQIVQRKQEANFELLVVTDLSRLNHESQSAFEIVREFLSAGVTVIAIDQKRSAGDSTEH